MNNKESKYHSLLKNGDKINISQEGVFKDRGYNVFNILYKIDENDNITFEYYLFGYDRWRITEKELIENYKVEFIHKEEAVVKTPIYLDLHFEMNDSLMILEEKHIIKKIEKRKYKVKVLDSYDDRIDTIYETDKGAQLLSPSKDYISSIELSDFIIKNNCDKYITKIKQ